MKYTKFQQWLVNFAQEKQIDMAAFVQGNGCQLQVGDVMSAMMSAPAHEQKRIKEVFVAIDFANGDVMHFIRHCAQALGPESRVETF
jgi:ribosomal protein S9